MSDTTAFTNDQNMSMGGQQGDGSTQSTQTTQGTGAGAQNQSNPSVVTPSEPTMNLGDIPPFQYDHIDMDYNSHDGDTTGMPSQPTQPVSEVPSLNTDYSAMLDDSTDQLDFSGVTASDSNDSQSSQLDSNVSLDQNSSIVTPPSITMPAFQSESPATEESSMTVQEEPTPSTFSGEEPLTQETQSTEPVNDSLPSQENTVDEVSLADSMSDTPVVPEVSTTTSDDNSLNQMSENVVDEQQTQSQDPVVETAASFPVEKESAKEIDSAGSATILFHKIRGLVEDLFKVSKQQFDTEVTVLGMQSDTAKVEYVFSLSVGDGEGFKVIKKMTDKEGKIVSDWIEFSFLNNTFMVKVNDEGSVKVAYEELDAVSEDDESKHYVIDKLNKFDALIESSIKKIKKEREQRKKEQAERKRLVTKLRDF